MKSAQVILLYFKLLIYSKNSINAETICSSSFLKFKCSDSYTAIVLY